MKQFERVNGGAAVKVKVTGDKSETVIDSESAIRAAFGNANVDMNTKSGTTRYANLPSTFCVFEKVTEGKKLTGFKIIGGGYGHGIGMSQNAANKMRRIHDSTYEVSGILLHKEGLRFFDFNFPRYV